MTAGPGPRPAARCWASTSCPRRSGLTRGRGVTALLRNVFDPSRGGPLGQRPARRRQHRDRRRPGRPARAPASAARPRRPGRGRGRPSGHRRPDPPRPARDRGRPERAFPVDPRRDRRDHRRRGRLGARGGLPPPRSATGSAPSWRWPGEDASPSPRGRLHARWLRSPAVTARVGLWLGISFGLAFVTGAGQPLGTDPGPPGCRSRPAPAGATGSPRASTSSPAPPPCRCSWSSSGRSSPSCSPARRATCATCSLHGARAGLDRGPGRRRDLPARHRARQRRPVVPLALPLPAPPTTPSPGSPSAHCSCTSRSSCPSIRGGLTSDVDSTAHDRPEHGSRGRASMSRRGLLRTDVGRRRRGGARRRPGRPCPWLRRVSVLGVRSGDGPQGVPINHSAAEPRRRGGRHQRVVPADGGVRRPRDVADPGRPAGDAADHGVAADRLRRGLERRRAPGPAYRCATCSTWSARRRGSEVVVALAPAARRRARQHPAPATSPTTRTPCWRCGSHGEPLSLDHGFPCRLIAPDRPGVLPDQVGRPAGGGVVMPRGGSRSWCSGSPPGSYGLVRLLDLGWANTRATAVWLVGGRAAARRRLRAPGAPRLRVVAVRRVPRGTPRARGSWPWWSWSRSRCWRSRSSDASAPTRRNPTLLDRHYWAGWWALVTLVVAAVLVGTAVARRRTTVPNVRGGGDDAQGARRRRRPHRARGRRVLPARRRPRRRRRPRTARRR